MDGDEGILEVQDSEEESHSRVSSRSVSQDGDNEVKFERKGIMKKQNV